MKEVKLDKLNSHECFQIFIKAIMQRREIRTYIKGLLKDVKLDGAVAAQEVLRAVREA